MGKTTDELVRALHEDQSQQMVSKEIQMVLKHLLEENKKLKKRVKDLEAKQLPEKGPISCTSSSYVLFTKNVPHILEKIFLSLDFESYKTCLEVSSTWKRLLTSESITKRAKDVFHDDIQKDQKKLYHASGEGNAKEVKRFLFPGMLDVNCIVRAYGTPMCMASSWGHSNVVQLLLNAGADINKRDGFGCTPLHYAATNGHKYVVQLLLKGGANVNGDSGSDNVSKYGFTPLNVARRSGQSDVVRLLLERGAVE